MRILSIDAGTYSVKYLVSTLERKKVTIDFAEELILPVLNNADHAEDGETEESPQIPLDHWTAIIQSISAQDEDTKVIIQYPHQLITSRYLSLPNVSNKKLDMMIPFQLDESIPYPTSEAHLISSLHKSGQNVQAVISLAQKDEFDAVYNHFRDCEILPSLLTSELDLLNSYVKGIEMNGPTAIIDIGHQTTKAYIVYQNRIISNHISHRAGVSIDQAIAKNYNITLTEASDYKHQNCFFLTEGQYDSVNDEQKEFALLMKETMLPLIHDIKRWTLGFRVKYGHPIEKIYLTGGTSQINNIDNFITQLTGKKTELLEQIERLDDESQTIGSNANQFYMAKVMAVTQLFKDRPHNFLYGSYSRAHGHSIPAHSTAFILTRMAFVALIFSVFLIVESAFINKDVKKVSKAVRTSLKSPDLALTRSQQRYFPRKAENLLKVLKKKKYTITQEVKTIQSATSINAISPLATINQLVGKRPGVSMIYFRSDGEFNHARFEVEKTEQLKGLEESLISLGLNNARVSASPPKKSIDFHFEEEL